MEMETISLEVSEQTAKELRKIVDETSISIGEVVDRLVLSAAPEDPEIALTIALEQYLISVSRLNKENCAKVFGEMCGILLGSIPPEELDDMVLKIKSAHERMRPALKPMTDEELAELRKAANRVFLAEGDRDAWRIFSAFLHGA